MADLVRTGQVRIREVKTGYGRSGLDKTDQIPEMNWTPRREPFKDISGGFLTRASLHSRQNFSPFILDAADSSRDFRSG